MAFPAFPLLTELPHSSSINHLQAPLEQPDQTYLARVRWWLMSGSRQAGPPPEISSGVLHVDAHDPDRYALFMGEDGVRRPLKHPGIYSETWLRTRYYGCRAAVVHCSQQPELVTSGGRVGQDGMSKTTFSRHVKRCLGSEPRVCCVDAIVRGMSRIDLRMRCYWLLSGELCHTFSSCALTQFEPHMEVTNLLLTHGDTLLTHGDTRYRMLLTFTYCTRR